MSITREDLAALQPGDVVELHREGWAGDVVVRGTVRGDSDIGELWLGDYSLVSATGREPVWLKFPGSTLTVISQAPRPLYVNHPRTQPVSGDVVRNDEDDSPPTVFLFASDTFTAPWHTGGGYFEREHLPERLRLLVDGETGQVVQ